MPASMTSLEIFVGRSKVIVSVSPLPKVRSPELSTEEVGQDQGDGRARVEGEGKGKGTGAVTVSSQRRGER